MSDEEIFITKSGRVLAKLDFEALADEAERGYDIGPLLEKPGRWACHLCWQTLSDQDARCNSGIHQSPDDPNGWRGRAIWTHTPPPEDER